VNRFEIELKEWQRLFLTSDTHFGHANIIKYCGRPFASADEMDAALIRNWNAVVGVDDVVVHLGDFAFKTRRKVEDILAQLNGHVYLVLGNHDSVGHMSRVTRFRGVFCGEPMKDYIILRVNDSDWACLTHYPLAGNNPAYLHLLPIFFGHIHTSAIKKIEDGPHNVLGTYDVGVDNNDFTPVEFDVARRKAWRE